MPPVAVVLQTYNRTEYAVRTLRTAIDRLTYNGGLVWIIGDDGSSQEHLDALADVMRLKGVDGQIMTGRRSYGGVANDAADKAQRITPLTFWLEDDWELTEPFDLTPYARCLLDADDVGMIRLGHLPVGLDLRSVGYYGRMYVSVRNSTQYMYSGNPHLKHRRFFEAYGEYPYGRNPGETEIAYDYQIRASVTSHSPKILWPLILGDRFLFAHIGEVQSYA